MKKAAALGYLVGIAGLLLAGFALLAPASLVNAARDQIPVNKTAIVDARFPERSASVDPMGRLQVDVPGHLTVQVANFPPAQQVLISNKSLSVDGTVKVSNLPAVQPVSGTVNVGNLPTTQNVNVTNSPLPVTGSVVVTNLPVTQTVSGAVQVSNLPAVQPVSGTVNVGNLPSTQNVNVTNGVLPVSGSVAVSNLPATQLVNGTVQVGNLPAVQPVSGTVSVGNFPRLDVTQLVYLHGFGVRGIPCTGFNYKVPVDKVLLVSDINYLTSGPGLAVLLADGATVGLWKTTTISNYDGGGYSQNSGSQHLNLTTPLAFTEGQTLCPLATDASTTTIYLSLVGQLVDKP